MARKNLGKNIRNNKKFFESLALNDETFYDYLDRFRRIALARFEWVNLPESMDSRWLELTLYNYGKASVLKDENLGIINTKCSNNNRLNIYGLPTDLHCFSFDYDTERILFTGINELNGNDELKEAVLVMNDIDMIPSVNSMTLFALRLAECDRTNDVNIKALKYPIIIVTSENQRLTVENLYEQYDGNKPIIFGDTMQLVENFKCIDTKAPVILKDIDTHKKEIWNEALSYLGINNINIEKKERAVTDEINSNNELINLNLESYLAPRLKACKQINDLFGFTGTDKEISVRINSDLTNIIKTELSTAKEYVSEDVTESGDINE